MILIVRVFGHEVLNISTNSEPVEYDEPLADLGAIGIASEVYADRTDVTMGFTNGRGDE